MAPVSIVFDFLSYSALSTNITPADKCSPSPSCFARPDQLKARFTVGTDMAASHKPHQCTACHRQFSRRHTVHQHWLKEHRGLGPWDNTRAVLVSTALTSAALPSAPASGLGAGARQKVQAVHTDVTLENIDPALLSSTSPSITAQLLGVRPADLHSTFSPNSFSPPPPAAGTTSPAIIPSTLSSPARIDSSTQFRSSRSNRHLNQDALSRNRVGGPIDHDPTEGLPINLGTTHVSPSIKTRRMETAKTRSRAAWTPPILGIRWGCPRIFLICHR